MARQELVFDLFIASPGDVADERDIVTEVVNQVNRDWSDTLGARLNVVRWETHTRPGIGEDAQDVIMKQIGKEFDVFVGILWTRYGSANERAGSGTEEEFSNAISQYKSGPNSISILTYFNDTPKSPSEIDIDQYNKVVELKNKLEKEGIFYSVYTDKQQFERELRSHLSDELQALVKRSLVSDPSANDKKESSDSSTESHHLAPIEPEDNDEGLLDLVERVGKELNTLTNATTAIGDHIVELGNKIEKRTAALTSSKNSDGTIDTKKSKPIVDLAADDLNSYTTAVEPEVKRFFTSAESGFTAFIGASDLLIDFDDIEERDIKETIDTMTNLRVVIKQSRVRVDDMLKTVKAMPRITTKFNKAKRSFIPIQEDLLEYFDYIDNRIEIIVEKLTFTLDHFRKRKENI